MLTTSQIGRVQTLFPEFQHSYEFVVKIETSYLKQTYLHFALRWRAHLKKSNELFFGYTAKVLIFLYYAKRSDQLALII